MSIIGRSLFSKSYFSNSSLKLFSRSLGKSSCCFKVGDIEDIEIDVSDQRNREYQELAEKCFSTAVDHNCFIIHPYIKWGSKKVRDTNPEKQIKEAEALVKTLPNWSVQGTWKVSLENLDRQTMFGSGVLENLKKQIRGVPHITAVFVNTGTLKNVQIETLERNFGVPIFDRYKIVMQILRTHATSKHAKLQVALAEIPYLRTRIFKTDSLIASKNYDKRKVMLEEREQKIKSAIKKLRLQREMHRNRRRELEYPIIAVVGYTNCGKTSLIKTLTGEKGLQPRNQLFATLDVTMHAGILPSRMEVIFVDTVGFISNIPTNLIECFVATLEDALFGDVILHVEDISNEDRIHQHNHVLSVLENLSKKTNSGDLMKRVISVGNKCDLVREVDMPDDMLLVSAKTGTGIERLREMLDELILRSTGRSKITIRVPSGGDEMRWLYKNSTVMDVKEDEKNVQFQLMNIIITQGKLHQFKHLFIKH